MEFMDLYNKDRIKTDKVLERGKPVPADLFYFVVHICIFNSNNQMLIQQRQSFKSFLPNMWDVTVGGNSISGENSADAAKRELFEEIGYLHNFESERPVLTINFDYGFDDIYLLVNDLDINALKLQYEEVQNVKWATMDEIITMIDKNEFVPYKKDLIRLFFSLKDFIGSFTKEL